MVGLNAQLFAQLPNNRSASAGRPRNLLLAATMLFAAATHAATAQNPPRTGLLAERFVDPSFGFSIRPFADARINRHKITDPLGGYQLVEFVHRTRPWLLFVQLNRSNQSMRPLEFVDGLRAFWASQHRGIETHGRSERKIAARQGAVWNGRYREITGGWSIFEAAVRINATEFFRITLKTPTTDEDTARALFDVIVDSFELIHSDVNSKTLQDAMRRGHELLKPDRAIRLRDNADPDAYLIVRRGDENLGFAHIQEFAETRDGKPGLRITERGWLFPTEKSFHRIRNDYFVSEDSRSSMFETRLLVFSPPAENRPAVAAEQIERGIRENDKLVLSYTEELGDTILVNDLLEVDGTYLPMGLVRILPRLVTLDRPELFAFSSYSSARKGLVLRTFRVMGRPAPEQAAHARIAFIVEDSEGITPPASKIYLDQHGLVRQIIAGRDKVTRVNASRIEKLFGPRVQEARQQLARLGLHAD